MIPIDAIRQHVEDKVQSKVEDSKNPALPEYLHGLSEEERRIIAIIKKDKDFCTEEPGSEHCSDDKNSEELDAAANESSKINLDNGKDKGMSK